MGSSEIPEPPPHEIAPGALDQIQKVVADPVGVPVHHTKIEAERRYEDVSAATSLSPEYTWFCLGLAYCLIRVDRSLFEVYQAAGNLTVPVRTHLAPAPISSVAGAAYETNPWSGTIQGIPHEHARPFIDFIESYEFKRLDTGDSWSCEFEELRCADPLRTDGRVGVPVWFALPRNRSSKRRISLLQAPGLLLGTPIFGVVQDG